MIARITRIFLILQLLVALGIAWLAMRDPLFGNPAIALLTGIGIVLFFRLLITANNFFLAWRYRSPTPPEYQLTPKQACRLFFGEYRATMTASSWSMPFRSFAKRMASEPEGLPVLLIHGYGCNSGYWHAMSKALLRAQISHHALDLEPVTCGIDQYVPSIHTAIERLCNESGQPQIVIVAHSMGGLAARTYLQKHGSHRVAKVITLGSPHHGTALALFGIGINTVQMRWTASEQEGIASPWLRALAAKENETAYRLFVSIFSHHDNIIAPQTSSCLSGAKNIALHGIGHVALAFHPLVQSLVVDEIRNPSCHGAKTDTARIQ